ncbi:hypothetical protein [Marinimicrobium locisalis]|uniref:hypothetical protein n=1 Tax=Marinimicrobium locisalis TaxID=546022 RepID=UPI003221575C
MSDHRKLWLIVVLLVSLVMVCRIIFSDLFSERTIAALIIAIPFTYWFVAPFIAGQKMEMESWGFSLEPGKLWPVRALLFFLGILILAFGAWV